MKKVSLVVSNFFNKNRIFDPKISGSGFYEELRNELSFFNVENIFCKKSKIKKEKLVVAIWSPKNTGNSYDIILNSIVY